jgi:hypothetical protein
MDHRHNKYKYKYIELKKKLNQDGGADLISIAWESIINFTSSTRSKTKNFDGLQYWNELKPFLESFNQRIKPNETIEWNPEHDEVKSFIQKLHLKEMDGEKLNEQNHFLLQQANIVIKNKPVFSRLMQIALNIGQELTLPISLSHSNSDKKNELKMHDIKTYMTEENYMKFTFSGKDLIMLIELLSNLSKIPPCKAEDDSDSSV